MSDAQTTEIMGPVDHAWLKMDTLHNPMVMVGILELHADRPTREIAEELVRRLLHHPRFSQVADDHSRPPVWRPVDALNLAYHVHIHPAGNLPNRATLQAAICRELSYPMDPHQPLWRVGLFRARRGRLVILFRAHHAIADGIAMLRLLQQLDDTAQHENEIPAPAAEASHVLQAGPLGSLISRLTSLNSVLLGAGEFFRRELQHPEHLREQLHQGEGMAAAILRVLRLPSDNHPSLHAQLSGRRRVAWTRALPIEPIHAYAKQCGVTLNDVFLAALASAFHHELLDHGESIDREETLRVTIPVNLRDENDGETGNRFGLVLLDLPVGEPRFATRLDLIATRMRALKDSPEASAVLLSLGIAGQLPESAEHRLIDLIADKSVAVVSNLPGPQQALHIAGARTENMTFFPPQAGHIGIGISLIGYAGHLTAGLSADTHRIADPERFIGRLQKALRGIRPR